MYDLRKRQGKTALLPVCDCPYCGRVCRALAGLYVERAQGVLDFAHPRPVLVCTRINCVSDEIQFQLAAYARHAPVIWVCPVPERMARFCRLSGMGASRGKEGIPLLFVLRAHSSGGGWEIASYPDGDSPHAHERLTQWFAQCAPLQTT